MAKRIWTICKILVCFALIFCTCFEQNTLAFAQNISLTEEVALKEREDERKVFLGGETVGFELGLNGVMVVSFSEVDTDVGLATLKSPLKEGDIICSIEGNSVTCAEDVVKILNEDKSQKSFDFCVIRGSEKLTFTVNPLIDRVSGEYRLGINVRCDVCGLGTVTFIRRDGRFGALGHPVGLGAPLGKVDGKVYGCRILGVEKGERGKAGSIKGAFKKKNELGIVSENLLCGIFGRMDSPSGTLFSVANRDEVKCGRGMICASVNGKKQFYDIEIVKVNYQNDGSEKGLVIKVTDSRLIALTGGIVQGMSGSPIIQNDKIVGAVTHVFINNPLRGYGIFIDNMLNVK
ncbi:MAG: hypothetical protein IJX06_03690 [Clostridia bacterium]|nr:hypothetical protein [Clostridia bacterium]